MVPSRFPQSIENMANDDFLQLVQFFYSIAQPLPLLCSCLPNCLLLLPLESPAAPCLPTIANLPSFSLFTPLPRAPALPPILILLSPILPPSKSSCDAPPSGSARLIERRPF